MTTQFYSATARRDDGSATRTALRLNMVELASALISSELRLDVGPDCGNFAELMSQCSRAVTEAYDSNDRALLHDVHHGLYLLQSTHFAAADTTAAASQFAPLLVAVRSALEDAMIDWLLQDVKVDAAPDALASTIREQVISHAAGAHRLFDHLEQEASTAEIRVFLESDARLNERFFDLLTMCLVGTSGLAKAELAANLWDEAGRGNHAQGHVHLFSEALASVGGKEPTDERLSSWDWQALAGHNLFVALCANRKHAFRAMGLMAATELLDPPQYSKLVKGCKRAGLDVPEYYAEHIEIDIVHGSGWLDNVVTPLASAKPMAARQIVEGVMLRLESCRHYYDALLRTLLSADRRAKAIRDAACG